MADFRLSPEELRPLVHQIVEAVLSETHKHQQLFDGKLAISEEDAAKLLSLNPWQLRDLRLSAKISYHRIVGNRIRYTPDDLLDYLRRNHQSGTEAS